MHTLGLLTLTLGGPVVAASITARYARRFGYQQGYRDGAHDLEDTKADVADLEQRFYALSTQRRAA
jgi:hypothetical protein